MVPILTQKELAQKCNIDLSSLQKLEAASGPPDQKILGNLERVLGIKLRGSDIGAPKTVGPKKK